ncbi:unnamed protein product [Angiostrongylus costaricensis]|uniref:Transposase n=1 Tax=Angiostrongylus costaricensis TaxID=334426 RepID=A0A0R3PYT4_ANGCS|nr:unnamed protein product [Angiostrongylus costaricensis]
MGGFQNNPTTRIGSFDDKNTGQVVRPSYVRGVHWRKTSKMEISKQEFWQVYEFKFRTATLQTPRSLSEALVEATSFTTVQEVAELGVSVTTILERI